MGTVRIISIRTTCYAAGPLINGPRCGSDAWCVILESIIQRILVYLPRSAGTQFGLLDRILGSFKLGSTTDCNIGFIVSPVAHIPCAHMPIQLGPFYELA